MLIVKEIGTDQQVCDFGVIDLRGSFHGTRVSESPGGTRLLLVAVLSAFRFCNYSSCQLETFYRIGGMSDFFI